MNTLPKSLALLTFTLTLLFSSLSWSAVHFVKSQGTPDNDHANASVAGTLQATLNRAKAGDEIVLSDNAAYYLRSRLIMKNSVTLRGKYLVAGYENQRIVAAPGYPSDFEMIRMTSGSRSLPTAIRRLWVDGLFRAWRIVETVPQGSYFTVDESRLENTKNDFTTPDEGSYRSPILKSRQYRLSIIYALSSNHLVVSNCVLQNAGLHPQVGKKNAAFWFGFADGITADSSNYLKVLNSKINKTLTGGIRLTGNLNALVKGNTITWAARNIEWYSHGYRNGPISDAITGYHNQAWLKAQFGTADLPLNWEILDNNVYHSGNNGIHVGGRSIYLAGNNVRYVMRNGIHVGDWRQDTYDFECARDIQMKNNRVWDSGQQLRSPVFLWNRPNAMPPFDNPRHGADFYVNRFDSSVSSVGHILERLFMWDKNLLVCGRSVF